jgi:hypothetical protein
MLEAAAVGARLRLTEDGRVAVSGASSPELVSRLREHKAEVAELLRLEARRPGDAGPCPACGYRAVWRVPLGPWRCCRCEPCEAATNPGAVFDWRAPPPSANRDVCRYCGEPIGWPRPVGIVFADGTAVHHACAERAEVERIQRRAESALSPEAMSDPAEMMVPREDRLRARRRLACGSLPAAKLKGLEALGWRTDVIERLKLAAYGAGAPNA